MKKPDLNRLLELQKMLLVFSQIERMIDRRHKDAYIPESDTEHSYNLAMTAWFLAPYFPKLDLNELLKLALVHDLVEVHAGDTYAYADQEILDIKSVREAAALDKLREEWPDFPDLATTIHIYEQRNTEEAKFIYALDKLMPLLVVYLSGGYSWKQQGITLEHQHKAKKDKIALSPDIKPYYDALHELLIASPDIIARAK